MFKRPLTRRWKLSIFRPRSSRNRLNPPDSRLSPAPPVFGPIPEAGVLSFANLVQYGMKSRFMGSDRRETRPSVERRPRPPPLKLSVPPEVKKPFKGVVNRELSHFGNVAARCCARRYELKPMICRGSRRKNRIGVRITIARKLNRCAKLGNRAMCCVRPESADAAARTLLTQVWRTRRPRKEKTAPEKTRKRSAKKPNN
jgi:hypothetical protein